MRKTECKDLSFSQRNLLGPLGFAAHRIYFPCVQLKSPIVLVKSSTYVGGNICLLINIILHFTVINLFKIENFVFLRNTKSKLQIKL